MNVDSSSTFAKTTRSTVDTFSVTDEVVQVIHTIDPKLSQTGTILTYNVDDD